ncbi:hypothetical protein KDD30_19190 (plasmid) [Photobacterium sp. GJ3]|uniref:hypothetical protein n=1 Tax=Photobacterium sp. GJ3 TaxID=2829502 RepID=UPI001B8C1256|nr:hypothetical protein [Photobacterium sp. GJ3]QUJ70250.1 hypothetical protein KDD30_19190 [Photobacterium sp. GJ3]
MTQLITLKNAWMGSHITEAEFPTPLSKQGLALYQTTQQAPNTVPFQPAPATPPQSLLSIYPVDCHPLTIRYALVQASQWDEQDAEAIIEFLTQIMLDESSPAQLFVGFFQSKPVACGMLFTHPDVPDHVLISDVCAFPLPNQQALEHAMTAWLTTQAATLAPQIWQC